MQHQNVNEVIEQHNLNAQPVNGLPLNAPQVNAPPMNVQSINANWEVKLERQMRIVQRHVQEVGIVSRKIDMAAFKSMTSKFTGDDHFSAKKWLDGTSKLFLKSKQFASYEQFKLEMIAEFDGASSLH